MGRKEVAATLAAITAAKILDAQEAKTKVQDPVEKNKTEVTATESQAKDCYVVSPEELSQSTIVVDTNDLQAVLSENDIKEAEKILDKVAKKYKWDDRWLNSWLSEYPDQELLLLETLANDKNVRPVPYGKGMKEKYPQQKYRVVVMPGASSQVAKSVDYLRTANNAREVLEKSGLSSTAKGRNKHILLDNINETEVNKGNYAVVMQVNPKTGELDGVSTVYKVKGKKREVLATLTYKDGKFVSGVDKDGKPIKKGLTPQQMALKKVLESRRVK
jgi:hypothetical protein